MSDGLHQPHKLFVGNKTQQLCAARQLPKRLPKVALCIFGTVRTFTQHEVTDSYRLLAETIGDTEIFVNIRIAEAGKMPSRNQRAFDGIAAEVAEAAMSLRRTVALHIDMDDKRVQTDPACWCPKFSYYHQGVLNRFAAMEWCYAQVTSREQRMGLQYDAVVTTRSDLHFSVPVPHLDCFSGPCIRPHSHSSN